jgi:GNAT superfamily N-acetyltransferase
MIAEDIEIISSEFKLQGWNKSVEMYRKYLVDQENNERIVLVAEIDGKFGGYLTIIWKSAYFSFLENNISEIVDFNVLIKYRKIGIGSVLLEKAEEIIKEKSNIVGIGVGLFSDYGAAQRLYAKRGYIPDGNGIYKNNNKLKYGDIVKIDDDVVLYFTKELN